MTAGPGLPEHKLSPITLQNAQPVSVAPIGEMTREEVETARKAAVVEVHNRWWEVTAATAAALKPGDSLTAPAWAGTTVVKVEQIGTRFFVQTSS